MYISYEWKDEINNIDGWTFISTLFKFVFVFVVSQLIVWIAVVGCDIFRA